MFSPSAAFFSDDTPHAILVHLPMQSNPEKVLDVIGKMAGLHASYDTFSTSAISVVNISRPSSKENAWYINSFALRDKLTICNSGDDERLLKIQFGDASGRSHNWWLLRETKEEDHQEIIAPYSPLSLSICRKVVEFFGGSLWCAESTSAEKKRIQLSKASICSAEPVHHCHPESAMFPACPLIFPFPPPGSIDSDIRWHLFYNQLHSLAPVSSLQLYEAAARYGYADDKPYIQHVEDIEVKASLLAPTKDPDVVNQKKSRGASSAIRKSRRR